MGNRMTMPDSSAGWWILRRGHVGPTSNADNSPASRSEIILPNPMPASGGSAVHAVTILREAGAKRFYLACFLATHGGIGTL